MPPMADRTDYVPPADGNEWQRIEPAAAGFDAAALAAAQHFAAAHETPWPHDLPAMLAGRPFRAAARQRGARPDGTARRRQRARAEGRAHPRPLGRHAAGGHDLQRRQELPQHPGRARPRRRADPRPRRADRRQRARRRLRGAAQRRHHLAADAAADLRVGRHAVRQVRPHRPQPHARRCRPGRRQGRSPAACSRPARYWEYNDARVNRLGLALLRRFGRALPEVFAERIARPDRLFGQLDVAGLPHLDGRGERQTGRNRCPAAATGAAGCSSTPRTSPASGC